MNPRKLADIAWSILQSPIDRTLLLAAVAVALTLIGVSPESRMQVLSVIAAIGGSALLAHGYQSGKDVEGTVPEGRNSIGDGKVSITMPQVLAAGLGEAEAAMNSAIMDPASASFAAAAQRNEQELKDTRARTAATLQPGTLPVPPAGTLPGALPEAIKAMGLLLLAGLMLGLCSCAANPTPVTNLTAEYRTYSAALDVMAQARRVGLIDQNLHDQIEPALNAVEAALSTARQQALGGGDANKVIDANAQVIAALAQLQPYVTQLQSALVKQKVPVIQKPTSQPATQPTSQPTS